MKNIIIVEDDNLDANNLISCINKYGEEKEEEFSVTRYSNVQSFIDAYNGADIVFLDIAMPGIDGMTAAKILREKDNDVTIVFVTNMLQMAINGYSVRAFDFIIKPVSYKNFAIRFANILKTVTKKQGKEIWINNKDGKTRINTSKIKYIEIMQHILIFHMEDENEYRNTGTLVSLQDLLKDEPFSMCNRCYFVNLAYVTAVKGNIAILNNISLQVSRAKKKNFIKDLNDYIAMYGTGE